MSCSSPIGAVAVYQQLEEMLKGPKPRIITHLDLKPEPCSVDLPIGTKVWEVSGVPDLKGGFRFQEFISNFALNAYTLTSRGHTLTPGPHAYIVEVVVSLRLKPNEWGHVNPKSSTGRIDLYCAVLAEGASQFNIIPQGAQAKLYLLVIPQSFPVILFPHLSLVQLRIFDGDRAFLSGRDLRLLHSRGQLAGATAEPRIERNSLLLRLDLSSSGPTDPSNLVAVRTGRPISLRAAKHSLDPTAHFRVKMLDEWGGLFLEPNEFALLKTERVRVPPWVCATMEPSSEELGEFRSHFAGFFDSGFGFGRDGLVEASIAVCEVRNTHPYAPIRLAHDQVITRLVYEYTQCDPRVVYGEAATSNYQGQGVITLAKYFKPWGAM